jgi:uncharacterized protein YciI
MPQFIILGYDDTDVDALNRRMQARQAHVRNIGEARKAGNVLIGVALTDDTEKMIGSLVVTNFPDRAALDRWLAQEPYVTGKVWKRVEILTGKLGPGFVDMLKEHHA